MGNYYGEGEGIIWFDDLQCTGNESSLAECRSRGWGSHNCNHRDDVSINCSAVDNDGKCSYDVLPITL